VLPTESSLSVISLTSTGNSAISAIGKGFAICSAALTALALFASYTQAVEIDTISLMDPTVIAGLFIGGMLPFLFTAMTMSAVGKAAFSMIEEVRRQFREKPGIMKGTDKPDYRKCVDISTAAALKEMIIPGLMAIVIPLVVGLLLGKEALGGFQAGALVTGVLMAIMMANAGGAWDNAKKYIESMKQLKYEKVEETTDEYGISYSGEKSDGTMAMFMYNSGEGTIVYTPLSIAPAGDKPGEPSDDGDGSGSHNPGFSDGGLGSNDYSDEDDGDMTDIEPWPEGFFIGIPRLEGKITDIEEISSREMSVYFAHVEMADAEKYIKTLKSIGYTIGASETSGKDYLSYSAYNNKGLYIELSYQPGKTAYVSLAKL
jgi:hypothetical protein